MRGTAPLDPERFGRQARPVPSGTDAAFLALDDNPLQVRRLAHEEVGAAGDSDDEGLE